MDLKDVRGASQAIDRFASLVDDSKFKNFNKVRGGIYDVPGCRATDERLNYSWREFLVRGGRGEFAGQEIIWTGNYLDRG